METIGEVERMGQMEDLKISLTYNFQGETNFIPFR